MSTHALGPLPLSPVEVGDLILQPREHVEDLCWGNREALYPAFQVRAYALAEVARAVEAERERQRDQIRAHIGRSVMSVYATQHECKAARDALRRLLDEAKGAR